MVLDNGAQVVAVDLAGDEAFTQFDLRRRFELRARSQPLQEMVGLMRKCGHVPRCDVEQVLRPPQSIRDSPPHRSQVVDDGDVQRFLAQSGDVDSTHRAAEASADNYDAQRP
jgi:hypothetical protein